MMQPQAKRRLESRLDAPGATATSSGGDTSSSSTQPPPAASDPAPLPPPPDVLSVALSDAEEFMYSLGDFLRNRKAAGQVFAIFLSLSKFLSWEHRDPFQMAHHENATPHLTDWDRWCQNEYARLAVDDVDGVDGEDPEGEDYEGGPGLQIMQEGGGPLRDEGGPGPLQEGGGPLLQEGAGEGPQELGGGPRQEDGGGDELVGVHVVEGPAPELGVDVEVLRGGDVVPEAGAETADTPSDSAGPDEGAFPFRVDDSAGLDPAG